MATFNNVLTNISVRFINFVLLQVRALDAGISCKNVWQQWVSVWFNSCPMLLFPTTPFKKTRKKNTQFCVHAHSALQLGKGYKKMWICHDILLMIRQVNLEDYGTKVETVRCNPVNLVGRDSQGVCTVQFQVYFNLQWYIQWIKWDKKSPFNFNLMFSNQLTEKKKCYMER